MHVLKNACVIRVFTLLPLSYFTTKPPFFLFVFYCLVLRSEQAKRITRKSYRQCRWMLDIVTKGWVVYMFCFVFMFFSVQYLQEPGWPRLIPLHTLMYICLVILFTPTFPFEQLISPKLLFFFWHVPDFLRNFLHEDRFQKKNKSVYFFRLLIFISIMIDILL